MAAVTKEALIDQVMQEVGDPTTDTDATTLYNTWFDDALNTMYLLLKPPQRLQISDISVTAAGFTSLALPATMHTVFAAKRKDLNQTITFIHVEELVRRQLDLTVTGATPTYWYWVSYDTTNINMEIGFYPAPSENFTFTVYGRNDFPATLGVTDTIPFPDVHLTALRDGLRMYAYDNEEQNERAAAAGQRFYQALNILKNRPTYQEEFVIDRPTDLQHLTSIGIGRLPPTIG
jgi:hypothetical protein